MWDLDDWLSCYRIMAAEQGWCLSETHHAGCHAPIEVQRWDNADLEVVVPKLEGDDEAVQAFYQSWQRGEPHALIAYHILAKNSPMEFQYWRMDKWRKPIDNATGHAMLIT